MPAAERGDEMPSSKGSMPKEFRQLEWDEQLATDCRRLVRLGVHEDLDRGCDVTTVALLPATATGQAAIVARESGVVCGLLAAACTLEELEIEAQWEPAVSDGDVVQAGTELVRVTGTARDLLTSERLVLNLLGRLCGVATQTRRYVDAIRGTQARVYDTRKTTPGWRRLEKYAVRCGGGTNHRTGLFDAFLIKDNHLAVSARLGGPTWTPAAAVHRAREFAKSWFEPHRSADDVLVEVEVDTLEQLAQVLPARPDIVLLDNMTVEQLRAAVDLRNQSGKGIELEASGGINLQTIRSVAETGVDRISVGALTHSAISLDVALDWK